MVFLGRDKQPFLVKKGYSNGDCFAFMKNTIILLDSKWMLDRIHYISTDCRTEQTEEEPSEQNYWSFDSLRLLERKMPIVSDKWKM